MIRNIAKKIVRKIVKLFTDSYVVSITDVPESQVLNEKVILLTGSTGGLGKEFAKAFLKSGARVILCGRNIQKLVDLQKELLKYNPRYSDYIRILELDQTKYSDYDAKFNDAVLLFGKIDALVNNAGIMGATIPYADFETYDSVLDTNLKSVFFLSQITIKYYKENQIKGNILNIASSSSLRPAYSAYAVSKWGIKGLTLGLAKLGVKYGITVNGIAPGPTATPMLGKNDNDDLSKPESPIKRYIHPIEIASMAVFLLSNNARSIVGDIIYMTGGAGILTFDDDEVNF